MIGKTGFSRRDFMKICALAAGAVGLPAWAGRAMAEGVIAGRRPSVIWLHFQECTGCSESLLRTSAPDVAELILGLVSLDYHETLMAAAGEQAERSLEQAMARNAGKYILVVEGAIPTKELGSFCRIGGRTAQETLGAVAAQAAAIVAIGSCASWGGIAAADPNPTGAVGVGQIVGGKPIVNLPGCPANPYNFLGTVLAHATYGTLPALDAEGRPKLAYARTIHEDCPRRPHFDAGRFATSYGDDGHREGFCLYKLGCKGPATHANCSLEPFVETPGAWPVGIGHPCVGCTEKRIAFRVPLHETIDVDRPTAPATYPPIHADHSVVTLTVVGATAAAVGALAGAGFVASRRFAHHGEPRPGAEKEE